jgi:hypothetical protein
MKMIYKFFMFALVLKMVPVILASMNIFPNTAYESLGVSYSTTSDPWFLLRVLVSGGTPIDTGINIPLVGPVTVQFALTSIIGILALVAIAKDRTLPTVIAALSAMIFIPFVVETGYTFIRESENLYHSPPMILTMIAVIIAFIALGVITLLEQASQSQGMEE